MLNLLDRFSDVVIKFCRDIITIFIFGLLAIGVLFGNVDILNNISLINRIFMSCFINYILSYIFSYYIINKTCISYKIRLLLPILSIIFSIGSIILFMVRLPFGLKTGVFILNLFLWTKGMGAVSSNNAFESVKNRFSLNLIVLLTLMMINYFMKNYGFIHRIAEVYLPIYFIITILYLIHFNLFNAYSGKNVNTINMTRNIRIFNIVSTLVVLTILLLIITNFFGAEDNNIVAYSISFILKAIEKVLSIVFYPVVLLLSKIAQLIGKRLGLSSDIFENMFSKIGGKADNRLNNFIFMDNPTVNFILEIFKWAILALFVLLILIIIFRKIRDISPYELEEIEEGEEKDFVLSISDIKHVLGKKMKSLINKVAKRNNNDFSSLHIIRRLYIEVILSLSKKGCTFNRHYTPNEYLSNINDKRYINAGFDKLTQYYNDVRYGHKEMDTSIINESTYIKESIDKID